MRELKAAQERLESALAAGDLDAARAACSAVVALSAEPRDAQAMAHAGRLADLGLQAAATVHELRQPLAGIKAIAQLVATSANDPGLVIERASTIERYAEMMEALCDRLRAYARAEPIRGSRGDVTAAVRAALDLLKQLLRKPPIAVETELAPSLPPVALDSVGVQQILVNLVRNAREAVAERQGHVRITTRPLEDGVEVTVADDGPGVPAEVRERLFTPFATGKSSGSGLGLWLSRRLAVDAGGSLELVDGAPGATFRLVLPAARET
jgi:two-component system, NtrC family, C4-dicarboxylate transport sensor histidine kinase DctB